MFTLKHITLYFSFFFSLSTHAYVVSTYSSQQLNYTAQTRILVTGAGKEQGTQFQQVANAKARKLHDLYPNDQIVLIAKNEGPGNQNKKLLSRWGFVNQYENKNIFNGERLINEIVKFKKVASIDIFAHGTALYGIFLEDTKNRFSRETKSTVNIKNNFAKDAYIFFHGCNVGFDFAPYLSGLLNIPVAGAMTSSDFQRLHNDGSFYLTEEGYYPNSDWAKENTSTFNKSTTCSDGNCLRLKPDNHPYYGYWGEYKAGGLPFYKFFCVNNSQKDCERVMAKSLYTFIGTTNLKLNSSFKEYKDLLGDFLCPISGTRDYRRVCREKLDLSLFAFDEAFNPFRGNQLDCDFKSCHVKFKCKILPNATIPEGKFCFLINNEESEMPATTLTREYEAYISGFKQLHEMN